jgi:hypothetical protein
MAMSKGGFSWKRAAGITKAKQNISRNTGIPLTKSGRQRKAGKMMTGGGCMVFGFVLILALTLGLFIFIPLGCGSNPEPDSPSSESNESVSESASEAAAASEAEPDDEIAWKLAVIKTGDSNLPFNDSVVNEFSHYLNKLEEKTTQTRIEIGDMTVRAWQILQEEVNSDEDLLFVISELNTSIPDDLETKMDLAEIAAVYIVLRQAE